MSHKVSCLTTTCWSGAFGRNEQVVAAWTGLAVKHAANAAAMPARVASDRAAPVLKFFIGESVKCGNDSRYAASAGNKAGDRRLFDRTAEQ
jgi:hypothetical protein